MPDEESEQTKEIRAVLDEGHKMAEPIEDEYDEWAIAIQIKVDKLMDESRLYKMAIIAVAGIGGLSLAMSGMVMKSMAQLANGLNVLASNQEVIVQAIPNNVPERSVDKEPVMWDGAPQPKPMTMAEVDVDPNAVIGKPYETAASAPSSDAVAQMKTDKESGLIDLTKTDDLSERNPENPL